MAEMISRIRNTDTRYSTIPNKLISETVLGQPMIYQIRIEGQLGRQWTDWFGGMTVRLADNGDTLLTGPVIDQAALHGLLKKVRDLGMTLLSVNHIESGPVMGSTINEPPNQSEPGAAHD